MAKFKARARALDMLGRQQIAGIPTAISELFKNAHDAYAENVIVDFFRSDKLFVLRDDGYGMTKSDFEEKWLTLGTESRINRIPDESLPTIPKGKERPIMGEKGIGRLAIASIGDHVLVLSRAKRKDGLHDLIMSFVYWRMFEIPGINLEQVVIPIKTIKRGLLPSKEDFEELNSIVIDNILQLQKEGFISDQDGLKLLEPLEKLSLVAEKIDKYLIGPSLKDEGTGTHFIICPTNEMMTLSIDGNPNDDKATPLLKALLGFSNTMIPNAPPVRIQTSFRDHKTDNYYDDLIDADEFWTPQEYDMADHQISGIFDEYGQFKGKIKVYDELFTDHIVTWPDNRGNKTSCGPFNVDIAYVHDVKSTLLSNEDYANISKKLNKISGLYIYKDGLRILPYGDSDVDFLNIELRRNRSAAYYFFSYRRLIGAISISRDTNPELVEKAGREGFRENKAYKQFREILQNFLVQIAADFFRDTELWNNQAGPLSEVWTRKRQEIQKRNILLKEQEKKSRVKKQKFQNELINFFNQVQRNEPQIETDKLLEKAESRLSYLSKISDVDILSDEVYSAEKEIRKELFNIKQKYKVTKPNGVALNKELAYDHEAFQKKYIELEINYFNPVELKIESLLTYYSKELKIDRRKRLVVSLENTIEEYKKITVSETIETRQSVNEISSKILQLTKDIVRDYEEKVRTVQNELAHIEPSKISDDNLVSQRTKLESIIIEESDRAKSILDSVRNQLKNISTTKDFSDAEISSAMEEEITMLRERVEADLELSQMGLAVGIIQHEFNSSVKSIQTQLRSLKAWADINQGLQGIYDHIKLNFDHLNGYLRLFAPLNRRVHPNEVEITGKDIYDFLQEIFLERISERRHNISIEPTKKFNQKKFLGYPSTFYPVFVNLVDNSIFWLKDHPLPRLIQLDADDSGFYISNNGPEIDIRDQEIIFEAGFSKKPNGTGLGLFISKEVLKKIGYDISVDAPKLSCGVTFKVFQKQI
jgi:signal transduction histidine kinase